MSNDTEVEYLEDVSLTDDLIVGWILQSRLCAPTIRRLIDGVPVEVAVEYHGRIRQRIGRKERTIGEIGEPWRSADYADLGDDELLPAAAPIRQTLRLGLLETPSTGMVRVEFARTKGGSKFWASPWYEGWGEPLVLDAPTETTTKGGRTPELVKADAGANLSASLSSTAQVLTRVNAHLTAHAVESAKEQGRAIGRAESLLPVIEHLQSRAEAAEGKLAGESAWKAVSDSVQSVVGIANTFANRPDLPQLAMLAHGMMQELTKQSEARAAAAKATAAASTTSSSTSSSSPTPQRPDRAFVVALLRRLVSDKVVSPDDIRAIAGEIDREAVA